VPLERIVEFRIAAQIEALPDVIYYVGKTGAAMFEERPQRLARPRDPELAQIAKKLDEALALVAPYYTPSEVALPRAPLRKIAEELLRDLDSSLKDIKMIIDQIQELKSRLQIARSIQKINVKFPQTEALSVFIIITSRLQDEAAALIRALGGTATALGDILIATVDRQRAREAAAALGRLGVLALSPEEAEKYEGPEEIEKRLAKLSQDLNNLITRYREVLDKAFTFRKALAVVLEVYGKSAIAEGHETGQVVQALKAEIDRLERQGGELREIYRVLQALKAAGKASLALPEGFSLYASLESSEGLTVDMGGAKAYVARAGLRGIEVPRQYLEDVASSLSVVASTLSSIERSLENRKRELEEVERTYKEYSIYGDEKFDEHRDLATVIFYVREKDVGKVDEALVALVKDLSININVVRRLRYKYFNEVPAERRPTLERFPTPVRQFVNKIAYMYGVPSALEVSPSGLVAVLFPIFFGWMFGDLGHGLLLAILGILLMTKLFGGRYRDWGVIWLTTGIFSMFFGGVVYGEFFGFPLSSLGLGWDGLVHLFEPVVGPSMGTAIDAAGIFLDLFLALFFGFLLMAGSFSLKMVNFALRGEGDMALGVGAPILLLYISAGMLVFGFLRSVLPMPPQLLAALDLPWLYILIAAIVLLAVGAIALTIKYRGYEEKPPIGLEVAVGLVEGIFGGLANVPSFSRLMILILMHGVFTKLTAAWAISLWDGGAAAAAIAVAVVFNALIAVGEGFMSLVQSLRLTFYETLSKFYEGRGRLFSPLILP
jgi:V/A-type H+-transporting ATPase subunit I